MPHTIDPTSNASKGIFETGQTYDYTYPLKLDLRPGSATTQRILAQVNGRARDGQSAIQRRHSKFNQIDKTLTAFIVDESDDKRISKTANMSAISTYRLSQGQGPKKNIVVPISFATMETVLTYFMSTLANDVLFRYRGVGPEDRIKAMLMELVVDYHCSKFKALLPLHTQWRDSLAYGFGVTHTVWKREMGKKTIVEPIGFTSEITGEYRQMGQTRTTKRGVKCEGNALENIDVYSYIPDPNAPIHEPQKADFIAFLTSDSVMGLRKKENDYPGTYFNARYLEGKAWKSQLRSAYSHTNERAGDRTESTHGSHPADVLNMYVDLIPNSPEWRLGRGDQPEKWLFSIAGDQVIVRAQPANLDHDRFPISVNAPTYDGYTISPISLLEIIYGLQEAIDWLYKSHLHNIRKALNNMFVIDPYLVNYADAANPEPGKLITIREHAWGRGVKDAIQELTVHDVTRGHLTEIDNLIALSQRVTGAVDSLQGVSRQGGERRSATEMRDSRLSALSRVQKMIRLSSVQSMQDIGYLFAQHTQQFMDEPAFVELVGRNSEELQAIYGGTNFHQVTGMDLIGDYDVVPMDATMPGGEFLDEQIRMFQLAMSTPETAVTFDSVRMMLAMYKKSGVSNPTDFLKNPAQQALLGNVRMTLMNDQMALNYAASMGAKAAPIPGAGNFAIESGSYDSGINGQTSAENY